MNGVEEGRMRRSRGGGGGVAERDGDGGNIEKRKWEKRVK